MESIDDRAKLLIRSAGIDRLVRASEIGNSRWKNVLYKDVRMSTKELEVLKDMFPCYALWMISGEIAPDCGQTSPEHDQERMKEMKPLSLAIHGTTCDRCKKEVSEDELCVSPVNELGTKDNRFVLVCMRCNAELGKGQR
jgi:hypothetical protein